MSKTTKKLKNVAVKAQAAKPTPAKAEVVKAAPARLATVAAAPVRPAPVAPLKPEPVVKAPTRSLTPQPAHVSLELVKPGAKQVYVAGSFNEWKPEQAPLVEKGNGRWVGDITVKPGRYEYMFVVDGQWLPDPNAPESVQNPYGGRNSVITVAV
jgi:hypothetical protein